MLGRQVPSVYLNPSRYNIAPSDAMQKVAMSCVAQYNVIYKGPYMLHKMTQLQYECKKIQNYTKFALNVYNPVLWLFN
jgi:hypothetical protein